MNLEKRDSYDRQNQSSSLQIVEPSIRISLGSENSSLIRTNLEDDSGILDYSVDEPSISLVVEDDCILQTTQQPLLNNEPPKRKRREIFQKYKKGTTQPETENIIIHERKFEETIEQVFNTKYQKEQQGSESDRQRFKKFGKKDSVPQFSTETAKNENRDHIIQVQKQIWSMKDVQRSQIPQRNANLPDLKRDILQKSQEQSFPHRISGIMVSEGSASGLFQSQQLEEILQSPIFSDQSQVVKMPEMHQMVKNFSPTQSEREEMTEYQKIDITQQSISSSVMIRQGSLGTFSQQNQNPNRGFIPVSFNKPSSSSSSSPSPRIEIIQLGGSIPRQPMMMGQTSNRNGKQNPLEKEPQVLNQAYEEERIPVFLRKARKANSFYTNFYHPEAHLHYDHHNKGLQSLIYEFGRALSFLEQISAEINEKAGKSKECSKKFEGGFTLQYFLNSGWEKSSSIEKIDELKPRGSFSKRPFDYQKVKTALKSYREIVSYYSEVKINLGDDRGRQKFYDIRKKFWAIQWNIRIISEDLYSQIFKFEFPLFYHECLDFLKRPFPKTITKQAIEQRKYLHGKYTYLKQQKDALSNSEVGQAMKQKLDKEMKFLCPF